MFSFFGGYAFQDWKNMKDSHNILRNEVQLLERTDKYYFDMDQIKAEYKDSPEIYDEYLK